MLKLTYTENNFYLEHLTLSLEEWVGQRVILALRVGQPLHFEPSTASFLLPVDLPGVERLKAEVQHNDSDIMALSVCDAEYLEVTLQGSWLSDGYDNADGVFVTLMSDRAEFFLGKLWQEAQLCASVNSAEC
ncbi:hypothetical protein A0J48_001150 [Sphaerospermopsis aphanizomenoides BCCUSP55]|uniref:alr0857 family protein n=1 Tax=Sphaerospermopsis aphanizomenoides TaxID=459663 RepID=UPI000B1BDC14|nr:alr0857 family protein [Sphaerospermopsis aphanizomenoides]MBK1986171.1 hypothetical protein [Sphaerospermopsis aphanizomenoides BCCUSP55]